MSKNTNMHAAKSAKNNEFYTQLSDIEKEMKHYRDYFKDKVIFCNCDDPKWSNFWYYFDSNFEFLELKKLISTHYDPEEEISYKLSTYIGESGIKITTEEPIYGDGQYHPGDFRSEDCIDILKQADIVITNPPFSLFREYVSQLITYQKKFIIIGSQNAITYKDIFSLLKQNKVWLGYGFQGGNAYFAVRSGNGYASGVYNEETGLVKFRNCCWFTNIDNKKRHEEIIMYKYYTPEEYPKYDNCNAINVTKVKEIPCDYYGAMGVPITFMEKYNPDQFEILGLDDHTVDWRGRGPKLNGKTIYRRIIIKRKQVENNEN